MCKEMTILYRVRQISRKLYDILKTKIHNNSKSCYPILKSISQFPQRLSDGIHIAENYLEILLKHTL